MERSAVPIGQGHMFKKRVVRHLIKSVDEHGNVHARCGTSFKGATSTWQEDRACQKCYPAKWPPEYEPPEWHITIGDREAQTHMPGGIEGLRVYCLKALEDCTSISLARAIVRFLGYRPPELILREHPEWKHKITYARAHNEEKWDYSRKIARESPFPLVKPS